MEQHSWSSISTSKPEKNELELCLSSIPVNLIWGYVIGVTTVVHLMLKNDLGGAYQKLCYSLIMLCLTRRKRNCSRNGGMWIDFYQIAFSIVPWTLHWRSLFSALDRWKIEREYGVLGLYDKSPLYCMFRGWKQSFMGWGQNKSLLSL